MSGRGRDREKTNNASEAIFAMTRRMVKVPRRERGGASVSILRALFRLRACCRARRTVTKETKRDFSSFFFFPPLNYYYHNRATTLHTRVSKTKVFVFHLYPIITALSLPPRPALPPPVRQKRFVVFSQPWTHSTPSWMAKILSRPSVPPLTILLGPWKSTPVA